MTDEQLFKRLATHGGPADVDPGFDDRLYALLLHEMRRPKRSARPALLLVAVLLLALALGGAMLVGSGVVELPVLPVLPDSSAPPAEPSEVAAASPTPSASQLGEWFGPVRTDLGQAVIAHTAEEDGTWSWVDPDDAAMGWVDITAVRFGRTNDGHWNIELVSWPPPATGPDGAELIVAHGLVLDTTGDGVADYVVAVDDDGPRPGDFRAWVTNLATGVTSEQNGPPYGYPVEFGHSARDAGPPGTANPPTVGLTFLPGSAPADFEIGSVRYYVWTSVTEAGRVVAWDYTPDDAWLGPPSEP